jgi:hypothetical protein
MAIGPDADVEGEIGSDADEHTATLVIIKIEIIDVDVAILDRDAIAGGEMPGDVGRFTGPEDDGDAGADAQVLEMRFDQFFAAQVLGPRHLVEVDNGNSALLGITLTRSW